MKFYCTITSQDDYVQLVQFIEEHFGPQDGLYAYSADDYGETYDILYPKVEFGTYFLHFENSWDRLGDISVRILRKVPDNPENTTQIIQKYRKYTTEYQSLAESYDTVSEAQRKGDFSNKISAETMSRLRKLTTLLESFN